MASARLLKIARLHRWAMIGMIIAALALAVMMLAHSEQLLPWAALKWALISVGALVPVFGVLNIMLWQAIAEDEARSKGAP